LEKIKLAFICSNLGQGGAERQLVNLISQIDKEKFEVTVFLYAVQIDPFYLNSLNKCDIKLELNLLKHNFFIFKIIEALRKINFFLKENYYDIIITTLFMNNLFVRLIAPPLYKNKIVTNMRTSILNYSFLYKFAEIYLIRKSYIVFNSQKSLEGFKLMLREKFHWRLSLIYNGYYIPLEPDFQIRQKKAFGCLGRLNKEKNIIQVVEVFQETKGIRSKSNLIVQGHFGDQYNDIANLLSSDKIEIREKDKNIDLFFDSIDVLILPSIFEGCPNVLFEALLRKKLCIVSSGANSDNFITNGVNGFVYDGSNKELEEVMKRALQILEQEEKLIIENGYSYAKKNFSMKVMVNKYEELFRDIYEKNKSSN